MYKKKPFFIVFEGVEGCGKSYQSKKLFYSLKRKKIPTILTREPGGTKSAELIRNLILKDYFNKSQNEKFDKYTDTLLYLAARNEHLKNKILPALKEKKVVIKNFSQFLAETKQNKLVDDNFINFIFNHSRKNLRNCFVIKQPKKLPFSYTREDVIIEGL